LQLGDFVRGKGQLTLATPGVIVATRLMVTSPPHSGQPLRFEGLIAALDCAGGALQLIDVNTIIHVQLTTATVIVGHDTQPLTCADMLPGDRVEGVARIALDRSRPLEAVRIMITHKRFRTSPD